MSELPREEPLSVGEAISVIPAAALFLSIVYIYGYSYSVQLPLLSLMTIQDFVVAALPWLLPAVVLYGAGGLAGGSLARAGVRVALSDAHPEASLGRRYISTGSFLVLVLGIPKLAAAIWGHGSLLQAVLWYLFAAYLGIFELGAGSRFAMEWFGYFGRKFIVVVFFAPIALVGAWVSGYEDGQSGVRFLTLADHCELDMGSSEGLVEAALSFRVGPFYLAHVNVDDGVSPVLVRQADVHRIRPNRDSSTAAADSNNVEPLPESEAPAARDSVSARAGDG